MGLTMRKYWTNFFFFQDPNYAGDGMPEWKPSTSSDPHTMVFQSTIVTESNIGAKLDPCVMFTACQAELTADFRREAINLFTSTDFTSAKPMKTCGGVEVGFSHVDYDGGVDGAPFASYGALEMPPMMRG